MLSHGTNFVDENVGKKINIISMNSQGKEKCH